MSAPPPRPTRTLHLCNTTDRRGAELSTVELVNELARRGVSSWAIALQPGRSGEQLDLPTLGRHGRSPAAIWRLRRMLPDIDVLIAHGASSLLTSYLATRGTSTPFVYRMIGDPRFWGDVRLRSLRVSRPLRAAAKVVTLWQGASDGAEQLHDIAADRIEAIVNGRNPAKFRPPTSEERRAARASLGLPEQGPVIGLLGALSWEKDPLLAIDAANGVPGATLAIAGDGPLRHEVEVAARASGSNTLVLGSVDDPQRFLWAIDTLLLTSKTEGLPGVVIEASLCSVPTVAADVGGTADLVDDTTGRLVPAGSAADVYTRAIEDVLPHHEALGDAARVRCSSGFTVAAAAQAWIRLFAEIHPARSGPEPR